jgi:hypothetical protein
VYDSFQRRKEMSRDFEYDYHNILDNSEELYEDECYYNDGTDEPWAGLDEDETETMDNAGWENYYHNIADELIDD